MYELEPFDECFDPKKHNKYLQRREEVMNRKIEMELIENIVRQINVENAKRKQVQFSYFRCLLEALIIGEDNFSFEKTLQ